MKKNQIRYLDLFAGAGGLSEGFIRAGFLPVAHVESDEAAANTLRTRAAYHWLKSNGQLDIYRDYLAGKISRGDFYSRVPLEVLSSVIHEEIGKETLNGIFEKIDKALGGQKLDLIIGGPPCQAYSLIGRACDKNGMKDDKRNYLFEHYAAFLKHFKPAYFVFENVTGLLSAVDEKGVRYLDKMRDAFTEAGYSTEFEVLSAEEYGVLQSRHRVILVGKRGDVTGFYPHPVKWNPGVTVKELFLDLPNLKAGQGTILPCVLKPYAGTWLYKAGIRNDSIPVTFHQTRNNTDQDLEIYRTVVDLWNKKKQRLAYDTLPDRLKTHKKRNSFVDRFKVVAANLPSSHTVVAHIAKDGHYYIHPDIKQNRSISVREAARIQTFPDDYFFESIKEKPGRTAALRQIGNAVPVLLAEKIAKKLREVW